MRPSRNAHPVENAFRRWRYLFLLSALLILLVVHPIAASVGSVGPLFDVLFALVMLMLVHALAQDKVWRVIAYVVPIRVLTPFGARPSLACVKLCSTVNWEWAAPHIAVSRANDVTATGSPSRGMVISLRFIVYSKCVQFAVFVAGRSDLLPPAASRSAPAP